jgi:membrane-associated PAP2 superfamily phosphatase
MNRTGLVIALAVAAAVGLVFGIRPDLDLELAALFFDPARGGFWRAYDPPYLRARDIAMWLVTLVALPAFIALALKIVRPQRPALIPGRAVLLMLLTLALAPGVVANMVFKEHWGRPRPIDVTEFGGVEHFRPWWDPRGDCPKNCSFVAGEPSGAFWTLAPAAVVPPQWRALAYGAAIAFGAAVGVLRMAAGAHFFSDVVFAGVFSFLVIWVVHGLIYRWRLTRTTDAALEGILARSVEWTRGKRH